MRDYGIEIPFPQRDLNLKSSHFKHYNYTREEAIELGQILVERGIIHHVLQPHREHPIFAEIKHYSRKLIAK